MIECTEPHPGILTLPLLDAAVCHAFIAQAAASAWEAAGIVDDHKPEGVVEPNVRSASVTYFAEHSEAWTLLNSKIEHVVSPLLLKRWNWKLSEYEPFQIVRYPPGGFYLAHRDSGPHLDKRYFSVVFYLNDDFEGGGTHFPDFDYTVEPETGKALIFPSDYLHHALTVQNGTKYITVTWLKAPPPVQWI